MCLIFSLSEFNAIKGSYLWLSDLKLIIDFLSGCLIFILSISLYYGNISVAKDKVCIL